jgi:hypothetical protein
MYKLQRKHSLPSSLSLSLSLCSTRAPSPFLGRVRSQVRRKFAARSWAGALKGTHGARGAPFWECRSSPEAVAPINQETSATSATPYCEHRRHVQKLLSPASFRFSRPTFSSATTEVASPGSFSFSNAILFPCLVSYPPPTLRAQTPGRSSRLSEEPELISYVHFGQAIFSAVPWRGYEINDRSIDSPERGLFPGSRENI